MKIERKCGWCGKSFMAIQTEMSCERFCSKECSNASLEQEEASMINSWGDVSL
jgi:hypothetical protein